MHRGEIMGHEIKRLSVFGASGIICAFLLGFTGLSTWSSIAFAFVAALLIEKLLFKSWAN